MTKRKAAQVSGLNRTQAHSTDANAQRQLLVRALTLAGATGVTTIEAREALDIMMPAARVCELRKTGWHIATVWTTSENAQGHKHRNARYVLMAAPKRNGRAVA